MGCCCGKDEEVQPRRRQQQQPQQPRYVPPPAPIDRCDICGGKVDPVLLDGHRESCRAQYKQKMKRHDAPPPPPQPGSAPKQDTIAREDTSLLFTVDKEDPDQMCVVCFEQPKTMAFVPCGHLVVCGECAKALDSCPICRGPRESLLYVDPAASRECYCKHCKNIIHPTFYSSHREVCNLRMRQLRENGDSEDMQHNAHTAKSKCLNCGEGPQAVALLPCGHVILCDDCAPKAASCPMCLRDVTSTLNTFK